MEVGFNPIIWLESLFKRLIESVAGRGGVEAIATYLDQIDFIPELVPLRQSIKTNSIFFEAALAKCNKELLKRPRQVRENEILEFLGAQCESCGFRTTLYGRSQLGSKCPQCGETLPLLYKKVLVELIHKHVFDNPEAVLMYVAYDRLTEAYNALYQGFQLVLEKTADMFGWHQFRIEDPRLRNYMDEYFLGRLAGESKIPKEEKQILQFLCRGPLAGIPLEEAEQLIRLAVGALKYGYLYEILGASSLYGDYAKASAAYNQLYDEINAKIRTHLAEAYSEKAKPKICMSKTLGGYYAPCLIMPKSQWAGGSISGQITLSPVYRLPVFPRQDMGALQAVFARVGGGKTFLLESLACYSILAKHEVVFSPLNDKTNSLTFASIPLFPYNKRTKKLIHTCEDLGIDPQPVPTLTLTFLRKGKKMDDRDKKHAPTKYDRIVIVDNPKGFKIDFNQVMGELKEIAKEYGYSKPMGIINVRNLDRFDPASNENVDVQVATNLLTEFSKWRKNHLNIPARILIDEISYMASSTVALYAGDAYRSGATISDIIKESRRDRVSIDFASQMFLEVIPDLRNAATNIFFRDLAVSKDKTRSQIDFLLNSIQLRDPSIADVVKTINNQGSLGKRCWFWYHQPTREIQVVKPCPPTFCLADIRLDATQLFHLYEKHTGEKILLDSWKKVPKIRTEEREEVKPDSDWFT